MPGTPKNPEASQNDQGQPNPWALALGAGTDLVVCVLVGFAAGTWLDRRLGSAPWLLLAGTLLGIVGGLVALVKAASKRAKGS